MLTDAMACGSAEPSVAAIQRRFAAMYATWLPFGDHAGACGLATAAILWSEPGPVAT